MDLKTTCLFFGVITLQFYGVFCYGGSLKVEVQPSGKLSLKCLQPNILQGRNYQCKFQLSDGNFIQYNSINKNTNEDDTQVYNFTKIHQQSGTPKCEIEISSEFEKLKVRSQWKCWIITNSETYGSIYEKRLEEKTNITALEPIITTNNINVRLGDNFMIGCQVMEPIDSCFLTSPNGVFYSVINGLNQPTIPGVNHPTFENINLDKQNNEKKKIYDEYLTQFQKIAKNSAIQFLPPASNNNFLIGDCSTIIEKAVNQTHGGNWTCHVHPRSNEIEIKKIFTVTAQEKYLLTNYNKDASPRKIKCSSIPTLPAKMVGCRWGLPNGTGIYKSILPNITYSMDDTSCEIELNEWRKDFKGIWSCFVHFKNDFGDEFYASEFTDEISSSSTILPTLFYVSISTILSLFIASHM